MFEWLGLNNLSKSIEKMDYPLRINWLFVEHHRGMGPCEISLIHVCISTGGLLKQGLSDMTTWVQCPCQV